MGLVRPLKEILLFASSAVIGPSIWRWGNFGFGCLQDACGLKTTLDSRDYFDLLLFVIIPFGLEPKDSFIKRRDDVKKKGFTISLVDRNFSSSPGNFEVTFSRSRQVCTVAVLRSRVGSTFRQSFFFVQGSSSHALVAPIHPGFWFDFLLSRER